MGDHHVGPVITQAELTQLLRAFGHDPTPAQVENLIATADIDGNGSIDLSEFLTLMVKEVDSIEEALRKAFDAADADGNGHLTPEELHRAMTSLGTGHTPAQAKAMHGDADTDGDGQVSYEEFVKAAP